MTDSEAQDFIEASAIGNQWIEVTMDDKSVWKVPVWVIALSRAREYCSEFGDLKSSLSEDTILLFAEDSYEICDWAKNNMNWDDVERYAKQIQSEPPDYQEGWVNGEMRVIR